MDKVTHFLLLAALILIILCCVMWLMTASCTAGFYSTHKNIPDWIRDRVTNTAGNIRDTVHEIQSGVKDVRKDFGERVMREKL